MKSNIQSILEERDQLERKQRELYVSSITNLNHRYRDLIKNDFGSKLVENCAHDAADEVVRRFFDTSDYYITPTQLYERIVHFSYDNEPDPLHQFDEQIRKNLMNMNDSPNFSATLQSISRDCIDAQDKLFKKEEYTDRNGKTHKRYQDYKLMEEGKSAYREERHNKEGEILYDEVSGVSSEDARLEVDHVQSASKASYNSRYISDPISIQALKEFYNSPDNFQMLEKSANGSKGDVAVYRYKRKTYSEVELQQERDRLIQARMQELIDSGMKKTEAKEQAGIEVKNDIEKNKVDITFQASAKQVTDAVCDRWEKTKGKTREELIRTGKLDQNGNVPPKVRKKLESDLRDSMNSESKVILKHMKYSRVSSDALNKTKAGLSKIIMGQVVYYVLPPLVFETQSIVRKKGMTLDRFFSEIKAGGKRIVKYVSSKLGNMLKSAIGNSFSKFVKAFFDILISAVKETVKRLIRIAKEVLLSLVQCVKIIASKDSSAAEKADAVTKTLSVALTTVALEVLFEYLEKQFSLPDILMEPLQIIVTIIATNLLMLVLQKADLFDVEYGFLLANIDKAFKEEYALFTEQSDALLSDTKERISTLMDELEDQIQTIRENIIHMDFYYDDVTGELNKINDIYNMKIDFEAEWAAYINI